MAEKKKYRRAKKNDILLPHVDDIPKLKEKEEDLSDGALRARESVDALIRDLFGEKNNGTVSPTVHEIEPEEEKGGIVESEPVVAQEEPERVRYEEALQDDTQFEPDEFSLEMQPALSFKEQIEASNEEFRLLLDMEYEEELGDAIGFERIRAYHERAMNGRRGARRRKGKQGEDFESQSQEAELHRYYGRVRSQWFVRLALSTVLFVLLLFYENAELVGDLFGGMLDASVHPTSYILIGLQLLLLDIAICFKPLWQGLVHLLRFSPIDHSPHAILLLLTFIYHFALLFLPYHEYPTVFFSPLALSLVMLALSELFRVWREALAFNVVAARRQKYAVMPRVSVGGAQSSARVRLERNTEEGNMLYLRPVGFVRNYLSNTAGRQSVQGNLGAHFLFTLGMGVALGLFAYAGASGGGRVLAVILMTVLLCAPATSSLLCSLPLFFSSYFCLKEIGAIVGESPLEEYAGHDTVVLPDSELFVSMEQEHYRLVDMCDVHRVTILTHALLEKVQSPLAQAFGVDATSRISTADLTLTHVGDEGVCAALRQSDIRVAIGTVDYMNSCGISYEAHQASDAIKSLCVAVNDRVCAVFSVRYVPCADLEVLLRELAQSGLKLAVRSKDPCVRPEVFAYLFPDLDVEVAVQKPDASELELRTDRVAATVVATGSWKNLARTLINCRRVHRIGFWGKVLQVGAIFTGGGLALLLTAFGYLLSAFLVTLWMLLWCGAYALLSYFYLRRPTEDV